MAETIISDLVFEDKTVPVNSPGTHVLLIGVGRYAYGKGAGETVVGGDLRQLTSPPLSARAMANWFIQSFRSASAPLASVSLLISEPHAAQYVRQHNGVQQTFQLPRATVAEVSEATERWVKRLSSNADNMGVFYFCGHGVSQGQKAALLLEEFGENGKEFLGAIEVDTLRGTMKNSPAVRQAFLLDCCRTKADDFYQNESTIGTRIVSVVPFQRGAAPPVQQFVMFPTLDGEEAFGIQNQVSVFTRSIIDAMEFAAADPSSGKWQTTTGRLLSAVDDLVKVRVPSHLINRSKPNALDATSFEFNEIDEPQSARSFVTISDLTFWGQVELECVDPGGIRPAQKEHTKNSAPETYCDFSLLEGRWRFIGAVENAVRNVTSDERVVRAPVAFVKLEVK